MNISDSTDRLISSTITDTIKHRRKAMFEYYFVLNNNMSKFITLILTGHNKVLYTYGKDNLLKGMTLNNQKTLDFVYDGIGRPTSHTFNLIYPLTTAYTYHGITSGGTVYKNNLIRTEKIGNGDFWYLYHYDANNNINRLYQNAENEDNKVLLEDYSYDALNQLENVNYYDRHERHEYTYDNGGNITEEKVYDTSDSTPVLTATNTYTYGDNSWGDLLTEYNGDTITYDEIGNPLNYRDGITFTWSNGRQLQIYTKGNTNVSYTYDSSGMRLSKTIGGTTHTYLYNSGLLIQETIGNQKLDYSYTSNGQILSVKYTADVNSNETPVYYYYALNSRGDVVGLYDHEGKLYAKYTYDVWGNPVSVTNASGAEITSPTDFANIQPIRYRSYYYDTDTGFYYLQSRYYDPVTHRFINADGLVSTGTGVLGYNMFAYCENNPIVFYDDNGGMLTTRSMQEGLVSGEAQPYDIMDVSLMMFFGYKPNEEFTYDTLNWARSHSYYAPYVRAYREISYKVLALINCVEFDGDIGFGFGAEGKLAGALKISALAKTSRCFHVDYYGAQKGTIDSANISIGVAPWDLSLIDETSFWTSDGQYFHETNTSPKPSISFGGYFIVGGSLTWSWSEKQYNKILNELRGG